MKLVILLFTLLSVALAQTCSFTTVQQAIQERVEYLKNLQFNGTLREAEIGQFLVKLQQVVAPCQTQMRQLVTTKLRNVTYVSNICPFENKHPLWATDACCNPVLHDTKCCNRRPITELREYIDTFDNTKLAAKCSNPDKIKNSLLSLVRRIRTRNQLCQAEFDRRIKEVNEQLFPIAQCFSIVFTERPDCKQNADCPNNLCDVQEQKCAITQTDAAEPLLQCIFSRLPAWAIAFVRARVGLKTTDDIQEVRKRFANVITTPSCFEPAFPGDNFNFRINATLNTREKCLEERICSSPLVGGICPIGNFSCQVQCGQNEVCKERVNFLTSQEQCENLGLCLGNGFADTSVQPPRPYNTTTCAQKKYCSVLSQCNENNGCTEQICLTKGRCVGFPFPNGACQVDFVFNSVTNQKECPLTARRTDFGCIHNLANTQNLCTLAKGTWVAPPKDKASCEALKRCLNLRTRMWTLHTAEECLKCNNTAFQNLFVWDEPEWLTSYLYKPQSWRNTTFVPLRKWGLNIDQSKLTDFFNTIIRMQLIPVYKDHLACVYGPLLANTVQFACDCGDVKAPAGVNCFANRTYEVSNGLVGFAGVVQRFKTPDAEIETQSGSVPTTTDNTEIVITKEEPQTASNADTIHDRLFNGPEELRPFTSFAIDQSTNEAGYLGSDGVKVQGLSGSISLCIKKDPDATVPTGYTSTSFATVSSSGIIVKSSAPITSTSDDQVCGTITGSDTYYVAYWGGKVTSNASSFGFGALLFVLIALLF